MDVSVKRRPRFHDMTYVPSLVLGALGLLMMRAARNLLKTVDDAQTLD